MAELNPKSILETVEVIRAVKSLFVEQNPYLPMYSALGGAFIGAVSAFFPNYFMGRLKERRDKRSATLQIYAEVKATLQIAAYRKYIEQLEQVVAAFSAGRITECTYQIQVPDDIFPIYKASLDRLGILDVDIQVKVVAFYQLLVAVIQDVKPGGMLNAQPAEAEAFAEALRICKCAKEIGTQILAIVEKRYQVPSFA